MNYWRFVTEAEPTKSTTCSNCAAVLKRSSTVWLLVATMFVAMLATGYPLFVSLYRHGWHLYFLVVSAVVWLSVWVMLVNFLSWQLIKWQPVDAAESP
ncbi:MAG TPA: hypothetical protein DDZ51_08775 [Planctomycetaceae bacterium]|nr:hypothetical protein [Planctomycetaceae bacterium]